MIGRIGDFVWFDTDGDGVQDPGEPGIADVPVTLMQGDKLPMNLEVLPRVSAKGAMMVTVINHDRTDSEYAVTVDPGYLKKGMEAWSMLDEKVIEKDTDGQFSLNVEPFGVSVFMVAKPGDLKDIKKVQARLNNQNAITAALL